MARRRRLAREEFGGATPTSIAWDRGTRHLIAVRGGRVAWNARTQPGPPILAHAGAGPGHAEIGIARRAARRSIPAADERGIPQKATERATCTLSTDARRGRDPERQPTAGRASRALLAREEPAAAATRCRERAREDEDTAPAIHGERCSRRVRGDAAARRAPQKRALAGTACEVTRNHEQGAAPPAAARRAHPDGPVTVTRRAGADL